MEDLLSTDAQRQPIVRITDGGEAMADSRDVAAYFDKRHDAVIRDVRNLLAKEPSLSLHNFVEFKINDLTGTSTSHFEMDKKGFTLLAMGFTGEKALKWKLKYIDAFELMEAELRRRATLAVVDYSDPVSHRRGFVPSMAATKKRIGWIMFCDDGEAFARRDRHSSSR